MIDKSSVDLAFEFKPYRGMLDKKTKKDDEQFDGQFVDKMEEGSKSGK